jgi:hypothetical protein
MGRVSVFPETDDLREIIGGAPGGELLENRKIEPCLGSGQTPA